MKVIFGNTNQSFCLIHFHGYLLLGKTQFLFLTFFLITILGVFAQEQKIADSLYPIYLKNTLNDTARLQLLVDLSFNEVRDLRKALKYADELINLSQETGNNKYLRAGYFLKGTKKRLLGNFADALDAFFKSAEVAKKLHHLTGEGDAYGAIADTYSLTNDHENAKNYYNKAIATLRHSNDSISLAAALSNAGDEFRKIGINDSALLYFNEAKIIYDKLNYLIGKAYSTGNIGMVYAKTGRNDAAIKNLNEAIQILQDAQDYYPVCEYLNSLTDVYLNKADDRTALSYALRSLHLAEQHELKEQIADANLKLSEVYEKAGNPGLSLKYYKTHIAYRDSINNLDVKRNMDNQRYNYEMSQKQLEVNVLNQQKRNQKNLLISLGVILGLTIIILGIVFKNNQNKQKAYRILNNQKLETEKQKAKAEDALSELQLTQKQLIQREKMASLGELTAGIAHEIQNPLNFVNNFSEINAELLSEIKEKLVSEHSSKESLNSMLENVTENAIKILQHGKRADSIVKNMLQHSKSHSGEMQQTDINSLVDEYLKVSYYGLRAKNKTFNCTIKTEFDMALEKINVIPQDIGRILINIFNNAFYSINEKRLREKDYEPEILVRTQRKGNKAELKIKDNGIGIPPKIIDKIYQPFFTTKPSGEGTGLGLSLSYDIIKAHQGELKVESVEGEYAEFTIELTYN